jgi:hypothetical protein
MPKFTGLKLHKKSGGEIFLHAPKIRAPFKPVGYLREMRAGWYSQTFESFPGESQIVEYLTYWGPVRPTAKQFRRYKKRMRNL